MSPVDDTDTPQFFQTLPNAVSFGIDYAIGCGCGIGGDDVLTCMRSLTAAQLMGCNATSVGAHADTLRTVVDTYTELFPASPPTVRRYHVLFPRCPHLPSWEQHGMCACWMRQGLDERWTLLVYLQARAVVRSVLNRLPPMYPVMSWGPVIDGTKQGLLDMPLALIERGLFNAVPTIFGTNRNEGIVFAPQIPQIVPGTHFPPTPSDIERGGHWCSFVSLRLVSMRGSTVRVPVEVS